MKMLNFLVLAVLMTGVVVSGCAGPKEETPVNEETTPITAATPTGDVMDSEISTIESDMSELEDLLVEMDEIQNISFNELDGVNF